MKGLKLSYESSTLTLYKELSSSIFQSLSVSLALAHSCTRFPCYLGMEI